MLHFIFYSTHVDIFDVKYSRARVCGPHNLANVLSRYQILCYLNATKSRRNILLYILDVLHYLLRSIYKASTQYYNDAIWYFLYRTFIFLTHQTLHALYKINEKSKTRKDRSRRCNRAPYDHVYVAYVVLLLT